MRCPRCRSGCHHGTNPEGEYLQHVFALFVTNHLGAKVHALAGASRATLHLGRDGLAAETWHARK